MTDVNDIHKQRWTLLHPETTVGKFVRGNAIPEYFVAHPEIGFPVGGETDWDGVDGGRLQSFTGGTLGWRPDSGVEVVTQ